LTGALAGLPLRRIEGFGVVVVKNAREEGDATPQVASLAFGSAPLG
jgi:hypothetical protein